MTPFFYKQYFPFGIAKIGIFFNPANLNSKYGKIYGVMPRLKILNENHYCPVKVDK